MNKIHVIILIIMIFGMTNVASIHSSTTSITNPGVFVGEVASLSPGSLDPSINYVSQGEGYLELMYEGLFQYFNNSNIQLQPALAENYAISPNGLTYIFYLRPGVTFALQSGETVGQPFNAYVMQYSIDRAILINDPTSPAWTIDQWIKGANSVLGTGDMNVSQAITFLNQGGIKALNANTLQITLSAPFGGFIQTLLNPVADAVSPKAIIDHEPSSYTTKQDNTYGMVSLASFFPGLSNSSILSDLGLPSNFNIDNSGIVPSSPELAPNGYTWLNTHSAGTGPYTLVDLVQNQKIDFAKNSNWWNKNNFQQYSVDSITITQVSADATRVSDLQQGNADTAEIPISLLSQFGVSSNHTASTYAGVNSYVYNTLNNEIIGMNLNDSLDPGQVVESSNSTYMKSNTTPLLKYSWKLNGKFQYASKTNPFSSILFRMAFANAFPYQSYIQQALSGFAIRMQGVIPKGLLGYDGNLISTGLIPSTNAATAAVLFKEVGWQGTITLTYNQGSTAREISDQLLQQAIQNLNVGITISVSAVSWNSYLTQIFNGGSALFQLGWPGDYADSHDYVVPYYLSGQTFSGPINYNNPAINNLIEQATSASSPSVRTQLYREMEQNATQDYPYIYLDQPQNVLLAQSWIQGINVLNTDSLNPLLNTLNFQYLAKANPGVSWPVITSPPVIQVPYSIPILSTQSSNSQTNSTVLTSGTIHTSPGFEIFGFTSLLMITAVILFKRKKIS